ncbi:MAG: DUF3782 domain-containing protein [Candidatus Caldarchaeum sp.]|jgi:hypothetical protein|uniref:DUF3782 domain-containing protein n=1 Tax=Caldiarchaeum subterraneum TaxID=311458 RepID=A0A7J3G6N2_CALS0
MNRHINALGARWSLMAESAFREELKGERGWIGCREMGCNG